MKLQKRENELRKVFRYKGSPCNPMFYRPNLWIHAQRVEWISREIALWLWLHDVQIERIEKLARYHDDAEIIAGDILSMDKENFSPEEKKSYQESCDNALNILIENYSSELWSEYALYLEELEKSQVDNQYNGETLEKAIVMYADKLDAHMEVSHEIYAWNKMFTIILSDFWLTVNPYDYTRNKILKLKNDIISRVKNPSKIEKVDLLELDTVMDVYFQAEKWEKHSKESVKIWTWNNLYDTWRKLHFTYWDTEAIEYLYNTRES